MRFLQPEKEAAGCGLTRRWLQRDGLPTAASKTMRDANRQQVQSKLKEVHLLVMLTKLWYSLPLLLWMLKFHKVSGEDWTNLWVANQWRIVTFTHTHKKIPPHPLGGLWVLYSQRLGKYSGKDPYVLVLSLLPFLGIYFWLQLEAGYWGGWTSGLTLYSCSNVFMISFIIKKSANLSVTLKWLKIQRGGWEEV